MCSKVGQKQTKLSIHFNHEIFPEKSGRAVPLETMSPFNLGFTT